MVAQYRCGTERRRRMVRDSSALNGIDFLEVGPDHTTLVVQFLHDLPGTGPSAVPAPPAVELTEANVEILGGTRFRGIAVEAVSSAGRVLTVTVDRPGDHSTYTLRLRGSARTPAPPSGFDPQLSQVRFSFTVDCASDFDCATEEVCPPEVPSEPALDYQAKDYASFRQLMLDRMSLTMPDWRERNPADVQVALVELLAYVGDHLSYFQDAVATEAYLPTALKRISARRHARLLDYRVHDGCNARTWLHVTASPGAPASVPAGRPVLSAAAGAPSPIVAPADLAGVLARESPTVFETLDDLVARPAHNEILLHTWSDLGCCLPAGATRATLRDDQGDLSLTAGDYLLFEEVKGPSGAPEDADPGHRQVVRLTRVVSTMPAGAGVVPLTDPLDGTKIVEVEWHRDDALSFPLCISTVAGDGTVVAANLSVARGNIVAADHGLTLAGRPLDPPDVPSGRPYRPTLADSPITSRQRFDAEAPASAAMSQDVRRALPVVDLTGGGAVWRPRADLLASDRFATEIVVESERPGPAHIRFGDGAHGRRPPEGATFTATCRIGNGTAGNVGRDTLTRLVVNGMTVAAVRNPLPAVGGRDPEPLEEVRILAPEAFRTQERAVTEADYAVVAERRRDIQKAVGRLRWTGSWYTAFVTADRRGGNEVDAPFLRSLVGYLDLYRMAGVDLEVNAPVPVPLDVLLTVCVKPGYLRADVGRVLLDALSSRLLPGGARGFFHPDNWTFGQPVYLSQVYQAVMAVDGVAWVVAGRFQRFGKAANDELEDGVLAPGPLEVVRLDNDPNFQENGRLELELRGGE